MHLEAVSWAQQYSQMEEVVEVVVQREQEWQHLDKTEGGGRRAGSADMAICY